jgi:uncharacterized protein DUF6445
MFNPNPKLQIVPLKNGNRCVVIDDALIDPELLIHSVAYQSEPFRPVDFNAYPGIYLFAPPAVVEALKDFFTQHVRRLFDARRTLQTHCRYSMVTLPAHALRPYQWMCHRDSQSIDAHESIQASVLYLFKDESLGGTSFYEPARSEEETALLFSDATALSPEDFTTKYAIKPGYLHRSNQYFRQVGSVAAKWNRLIFYDGSMLHSGDIFAPEKLTPDPLKGRLTLNGFFTSRRNAN